MTSLPTRAPLADHLITPQNAAFVFIDYQPEQLAAVRSMDHHNAVSTARTIKTSFAEGKPPSPQLATDADAALHGYVVAFWVAAGVIAFGALVVGSQIHP